MSNTFTLRTERWLDKVAKALNESVENITDLKLTFPDSECESCACDVYCDDDSGEET